ncbi:MAG: alpha/beta fold hydrolase [Chloroflexi bacterium]|nr:alpha/beta fold hydrolase [Chloroflexota bacterium]
MLRKRSSNRRRLLAILLILLLLSLVGLLAWAGSPSGQLMPQAQQALSSDERVVVKRERWILFEPRSGTSSTGFIFYPGGRVQAEAYAPLGKAIANRGYRAVLVPMPFNLAILAPDAADDVMASFPQISRWVIGGHSLGGVMAARYAHSHPDRIDGLVLVASYPEAGVDLSRSRLPVATIYAELDGLSELRQIEDSFPFLPPDAIKVMIAGGNHAGFGWYGPQSGDKPAAISRQDQQVQLSGAILAFLQEAG